MRQYSQEIIHEGQRVANTVKNLLSFSQYKKQTFYTASVQSIVEETVALIESVLRHDQISLTVNIADDLPDIRCNPQQIRQVLMNLLTNARDTLNSRYPDFNENKRLFVNATLTERKGQPWIRFTIEDHGAGISEELLPKVFDPFFTTSMRSEHAGLGLAISLGIVKEHHGDIWFESKQNEYTCAIVELPVDGGVLV
jgi:signal transduction histidine kinase